TGAQIVHIPYKGTAASLTAVIAGEVQFSFANVPAILGHVKSGRIHALAVLSPRRSELMPDVPTMKEAGVEDVEVPVWYAILAPGAGGRGAGNGRRQIRLRRPYHEQGRPRYLDPRCI